MQNEHTIAENLQRLVDAKTAIANAITAKGGTVAQGDGLEEYPTAINGIQGGLEMNVKFAEGSNEIPPYMFYNNHGSGSGASTYNVTEFTIGDNISAIGKSAFRYNSIKRCTIPSSIRKIEEYAFASANIETLEIKSVNLKIEGNAFQENNIKQIIWPQNLEYLYIGYFSLADALSSSITEFEFPDGTAFLGTQIFGSGNSHIKRLIVKSGAIQYRAFLYTNFIDVEIGTGTKSTTIGNQAFLGCDTIETVRIGNTATDIGTEAFYNCSGIQTITINKPQGSISGAPWGATNATVVWTG